MSLATAKTSMSAAFQAVKAAPIPAVFSRGFAASAAAQDLKQTALYDFHKSLGGKMVPFAGYSLPVQFKEGVLTEHLHTRAPDCASIFDVGHMGQLRFHGKDAVKAVERLVVGDIAALKQGETAYSLIPKGEAGGILDDTVITNFGDYIGMVVNGARRDVVLEYFAEFIPTACAGLDVKLEELPKQNLVALQGPGSARALAPLLEGVDLARVPFLYGFPTKVAGKDCIVTRCGYTGEDGFEVSMAWDDAVHVASALLEQDNVKPAGLGARDSLRLESGLCLYGHDLDESINPVEANLVWTIGKRRRSPEGGEFPGKEAILSMIKEKSWTKKRVGLGIKGAPAREGAKLFDDEDNEIGVVTSGTMSPCLKRPIAMGYLKKGFTKIGTVVQAEVRNKRFPATVEKLPFVPPSTYRIPDSE